MKVHKQNQIKFEKVPKIALLSSGLFYLKLILIYCLPFYFGNLALAQTNSYSSPTTKSGNSTSNVYIPYPTSTGASSAKSLRATTRYNPPVNTISAGSNSNAPRTDNNNSANPLTSTGDPTSTGANDALGTGAPDNESSPSPSTRLKPNETGRFQTTAGQTKVAALFLEGFKSSVVRVRALDESGNKLNEAMGVALGVSDSNVREGDSIYIATPLSLMLGNSLQWADKIEITHNTGTTYSSEVAYIDEQLGFVLLKPKNKPTPIRFVPPANERGQIDIFTISFDYDSKLNVVPNIHSGVLAAVDPDEGTLAISGREITNAQAGTAIINMQGQLMGMLLPNGSGVLSSAFSKAIARMKGKPTFSPRLAGAIIGRGVLVDPNTKEAYKTIEEALVDIKKGAAPKADRSRYVPATSEAGKSRTNFRPILKVAIGTFHITNTIELPSNFSFSGSGPKNTVLVGDAPDKPILSLDNTKNVSITNFRIVPHSQQTETTATISIKNSENLVILGNIIEAKGGRALHFIGSKKSALFGNTFPEGKNKAIYCQTSALTLQANAFLGKWPQALAVGKDCIARVDHNLFIDNEISVAVSGESTRLRLQNNTFLRSIVGARFYGKLPDLNVDDNLFFVNRYSLLTNLKFPQDQIGRNSAWKSVAFQDKQMIAGLDFVKGKPEFRNSDRYDFRLLPGSPGAASGLPEKDGSPTDMGAYQPETYLGEYTSQFIVSLQTAIGEKNLAEAWGFKLLSTASETGQGIQSLTEDFSPVERPAKQLSDADSKVEKKPEAKIDREEVGDFFE